MSAATSTAGAHVEREAHVLTCAGCMTEYLLTPNGLLEVGSMKPFATTPRTTQTVDASPPRAEREAVLMDPDIKPRPRP